MKKAEEDHIKSVGEGKFNAAHARAAFVIRSDSRLTGLDKIREPLALQAALEATGYPKKAFTLGKKEIPADTMAICADLLDRAKAAASAEPR